MIINKDFQTFLYVGKKELSVSVFKGKEKKIFSKKKLIHVDETNIDETFNFFLEAIIFDIEKKIDSFINKINLILDEENFLEVYISKKENDNILNFKKENIQYLVSDLKRQIQENYKEKLITKIKIKNFIVDGVKYTNFEALPSGKIFCLEVLFLCIENNIINRFKKNLLKFEIDINKVYSTKSMSKKDDNTFDVCNCAASLFYLGEPNEVHLISKNYIKKSLFEKFFELF